MGWTDRCRHVAIGPLWPAHRCADEPLVVSDAPVGGDPARPWHGVPPKRPSIPEMSPASCPA